MKDKKLQVFVSSTYEDLKDERQAAVEAILSAGHIPAGMELFSAGDESQITVIKRWIDESDVYLLILGGRYGSINSVSGKSYIHLEYEYALKQNKPLFAVVITDSALDTKVKSNGRKVIEQDSSYQLKEFRGQVLNNLVKFFDDKKDIKLAVHETLSEFSYRRELVGWIRGNNSITTDLLVEQITRLTKENSELKDELFKIKEQQKHSVISYNGLTYEEVVKLLSEKSYSFKNQELTLFEFLKKYGKLIGSNAVIKQELTQVVLSLEALKIISKYKRYNNGYSYKFTNDGHNFYLRLLVK